MQKIAYISVVLLAVPFAVLAQCPSGGYPNPLGVCSFLDLITQIANYIRPTAIILGVIALIVVGFRFVSAAFSGRTEEMAQARKTLLWVLIGTAIVVAATVVAPAIVAFIRRL